MQTIFPILDAEQTEIIRAYAREAAAATGPAIVPAVRNPVRQLETTGRENNASKIVLSYVLDGLMWRVFGDWDLIDRREISVDVPFWAGEIWAMYPERPFSSGTNFIAEAGVSLERRLDPADAPVCYGDTYARSVVRRLPNVRLRERRT